MLTARQTGRHSHSKKIYMHWNPEKKIHWPWSFTQQSVLLCVRSVSEILSWLVTGRNVSKYLVVKLSNNLNWKTNTDRMTMKSNSMLGFLRRYLLRVAKKLVQRTYRWFVQEPYGLPQAHPGFLIKTCAPREDRTQVSDAPFFMRQHSYVQLLDNESRCIDKNLYLTSTTLKTTTTTL